MLSGVITLLAIFGFKKKGLGLERAKDCCSANALEKKLPDIRKATGRGGGIESIDKGLEDNWWGGGWGDSFIRL